MDVLTAYGLSLGIIFITSITRTLVNQVNANKIENFRHLKDIKGNITLTKHLKISEDELTKGALIVAPSAMGKTTRFYKHLIKSIKRGSIIMTDPSGKVADSIIKNGYTVYRFNPFDLKHTIGWNIFESCSTTYELRNLMRILLETGFTNNCRKQDSVNQKEWLQISESLLMAYALMNYHEHRYNLAQFVDNLLSKPLFAYDDCVYEDSKPDEDSIEYEIYQSGHADAVREFKQFLQCRGSGCNIVVSIRTILTSAFRVFAINEVRQLMSLPSFDFKRFRDENILLYIEVPEQYVNDLKPITNVMIQQIFNTMFRYKATKEDPPVYLLLDELGNIGELPKLSETLTQSSKRNMAVIGALQSISQLKKSYGEAETELLLDAFQTKLVTCGLSTSNDYFIKLIGNKEKISKAGNKSYEPLITADELREMSRDNVIIINGNHKPVKDKLLNFLPNNKVIHC